jgi:hypothetical protein
MIIWQFRDDAQVVKFMTRFVAKVSKIRSVCVGWLATYIFLFCSVAYVLPFWSTLSSSSSYYHYYYYYYYELVCWIQACV